jgi:hypothetical protein
MHLRTHHTPARRDPQRPHGWRTAVSQAALILGGIVVYFGVRGLTVTEPQTAMRHAVEVVSFERGLGVYVEPRAQDLIADSPSAMTIMNWVYIWCHWPIIIATLLWLFFTHYGGYRVIRDAMLISGAVGLLVFAVFPVAPPRLAGLGLVDTVTDYSRAYRVLQPPAFVNQYAAMPSLHVGWDLLMGIALATYGGYLAVRVVGVVLPLLMAAAVVLTANHYVIDVAVGAALVLASLYVALQLERRRERHELPGVPAQRDALASERGEASGPAAGDSPSVGQHPRRVA